MKDIVSAFAGRGRLNLAGAPPGEDARLIGRLAEGMPAGVLVVARDDVRLSRLAEGLAFFAPQVAVHELPAWDCLPYDRVSPNPQIVARRIDTLSALATAAGNAAGPRVVLTTVAAALQRLPPPSVWMEARRRLDLGERLDAEDLARFLQANGYIRVEAVTEAGDYAVRGGIIDVFPPGRGEPLRVDLFGDEIDSLRTFDPTTQRSLARVDSAQLMPVSEVLLDEASIRRFRAGFRALAGAKVADDPLYAAISAGRRHAGMEHWLPLFHERMETLFTYLPGAPVIIDHMGEQAIDARLETIEDYFAARRDVDTGRFGASAPYWPVPVSSMFLGRDELDAHLADRPVGFLLPFAAEAGETRVFDGGGRTTLDFAEARKRTDVNLLDLVIGRIRDHQAAGRRVLITAVSRGSRERLGAMLREHGFPDAVHVGDDAEARGLDRRRVGVAVLGIDHGFVTDDLAVLTEEDIFGDRLARRAARRVRPENFLTETTSLASGDLVVHTDHGIGRYEGLETLSVGGAPHDCLRIVYAQDDKLYLPVENIEMISRFGSDAEGVVLDRLGGAAWQSRKAKLKQRIREIAAELIRTAALRAIKEAPEVVPPHGAFDEFCARFPYDETDDQLRAVDDVLRDLASGRPADRLICGDVGFGKTEIALRAAFAIALEGRQVAVVVPTTLLARQHYRTFVDRFRGLPVRIEELSRLVPPATVRTAKAGLADGSVDIVVGTHALLAKDIRFRDLGLLIIDEEQHFGVSHKERLKQLRADVHVLTLTATPIPRTLQMALAGVRDMSLITTPPVDRLAVRTFVMEFDPVVTREAILREQMRGGQTFYVCPRIEDLAEVQTMLAALVPEVRLVQAHGRMAPRDLEAAVGAFYDRNFDVLLSTNIIESGLDLPAVNTIIIHRADMFGLAQLYQLRGRVGRSKLRAYAYLTLPPRKKLTATAAKRLSVMQALDALGAGFTLASHDLDIRGAGNLLGDEQSGHIREVGIELYQQMLEDAVAEARGGEGADAGADDWSPQIAVGLSVLIPEAYVPDLGLRLGLYRRLASVADRADIDAFAAELIDRFGPIPEEANNLLEIVGIKALCRRAGIERLEAGPKGAVIGFRDNVFANPSGLVAFIGRHGPVCKLRPDHKLVFRLDLETPGDRLSGVRALVTDLTRIASGQTTGPWALSVSAPPPPPPAPVKRSGRATRFRRG
ncbi:MAG: transcription-repair coupling factor [Rhodospirillales bacterium]